MGTFVIIMLAVVAFLGGYNVANYFNAFTGLYDMCGRQIKLGDVVSTPDGDACVVWWKAGFYFKFLYPKGRPVWNDINPRECKILSR